MNKIVPSFPKGLLPSLHLFYIPYQQINMEIYGGILQHYLLHGPSFS